MAKKNDLDDENINEENQGDINEADDSFGLPDVDYKPLEEESSDESATVEEETFAYSDNKEADAAVNTEEEPREEQAYVPGSYSPPKEESNKSGIIIGVIVFLLIAVGVIWYVGFHLPAEEEMAEKARIEKQRQDKIAADKKAAEKAEADRIAQQQAEVEAAKAAEEEIARKRRRRRAGRVTGSNPTQLTPTFLLLLDLLGE